MKMSNIKSYVNLRMCFSSKRKQITTVIATFFLLTLAVTRKDVGDFELETTEPPLFTSEQFEVIQPGDYSWIYDVEIFFRRLEFERPEYKCKKLMTFGGHHCNGSTDGDKRVCLDPGIAPDPRNCTVYSIGISIDTSFDQAMDRYGCTVYMMDPSLPPFAYENLKENKTKSKMRFFPIGIGGGYAISKLNVTIYEGFDGIINATIMPYEGIRDAINHHGHVDYLKMDVEGAEWKTLEHMLKLNQLRDIPQFAFELHATNFQGYPKEKWVPLFQKYWWMLEQLGEQGLKRVHYMPNPTSQSIFFLEGTNRNVATCGELFMVNPKYRT